MQLSHTPAAIDASFDDPNLIGSAGLLPLVALAEAAGLGGAGRRARRGADG
jgi:hypothetical protein